MKNFLPLLLLGPILFLAACSSTSMRLNRIEKNPALFQALPSEEQRLVSEGKIREGMSTEAVFLAWGPPDSVSKGSREGAPYENWIYTIQEPFVDPHFYYGMGYRHYRRHGHPYFVDYGFSPGFIATSREVFVGRVEFRNGQVISWESRW